MKKHRIYGIHCCLHDYNYLFSLTTGIVNAYIDGDKSCVSKASGFFKGYTWAMEKNNTGRSEIMPLFEGRGNVLFVF